VVATDNGGTLTLEEGVYNKTTDRGNTIDKNITIIGQNATIDADKSGRIFTISGNNNTVTFIGITFINGKSTNANGGAIYNPTKSSLIFIDCTFINNHASYTSSYYYGGAIYSNGQLTVDNCEFYNNSATWGGAIYTSAGFDILNSRFINNTAQQALTNVASGGAAINIMSNNVVYNSTINNCYFENNVVNASSQYGAAICDASTYGTSIAIINSQFINNSGRTIIHTNNDDVYIDNCYFEGNKGNGIIRLGFVTGSKNNNAVENCIFINNSVASSGQDSGCISADNILGLNIYNNTFINNNLAIYLVGSSGKIHNNNINGTNGISDIGTVKNLLLEITNNTIITSSNGIYVAYYNSHNLTVNHNRIISNAYAIYTERTTTTGVNADYNWFGQNKPNVSNINLNYWYVANVANITAMDKTIVYFTYIMTLNNGDTSLIHLLPDFTGKAYNNGVLTYTYDAKQEKNMKFVNDVDTSPLYYFIIDNEAFTFREQITNKIDTNTTINTDENITEGDTITITGQVTDENGDIVGNITINVEIDGDIFNVDVDENGNWNLDYTVNRSGDFDIITSWDGNSIYNGFNNNAIFNANIKSSNSDEIDDETIDETITDFIVDEEEDTSENQGKNINLNTYDDENSKLEKDIAGDGQSNSMENTSTDKTTKVKASMKETGMPIVAILLVLISVLGIVFRRK